MHHTTFSAAPALRPRLCGPGSAALPRREAALLTALTTVALTAGVLLGRPAHAQAGGWTTPTTTVTGGTTTWSDWAYNQFYSGSNPWPLGAPSFGDVARAGDYQASNPSSADTTGTLSCASTWQGPGAPPPHVYILEQGSADGACPSDGAASADDGLGDAAAPLPDGPGMISSGKHLRQVDGSSGTITRTATINASASSPSGGEVVASGGYSWAFDTRGVSISSSLGQTHRRPTTAPYQPVANIRGTDGTLTDDTLAPISSADPFFVPGTSVSVLYSAGYAGAWGTNSTYKWYSSMTGESDSGTFTTRTPNPIPFTSSTLVYNNAPASPGAQEHVYVHLTDSSDEANATANYYLNFYSRYEDWYEDTSKSVNYPREIDLFPGDWTYLYTIDNDSSIALTKTTDQGTDLKQTMSGTIGGDSSSPALKDIFQLKANISVGQDVTYTFKAGTSFTAPAWTRTSFYAAMSYQTETGTCSTWGSDGYDGDAIWNGLYSSGAVSTGTVQEVTYTPNP